MYCRNCGNKVDENAYICVNCGVILKKDNNTNNRTIIKKNNIYYITYDIYEKNKKTSS